MIIKALKLTPGRVDKTVKHFNVMLDDFSLHPNIHLFLSYNLILIQMSCVSSCLVMYQETTVEMNITTWRDGLLRPR